MKCIHSRSITPPCIDPKCTSQACIDYRVRHEEYQSRSKVGLSRDPVNHPDHDRVGHGKGPAHSGDPINPGYYKRGGFEVADIIDAFVLNWRLANVVKYVLRAGMKGDAIEDLEKARWYLIAEIEKRKREAGEAGADFHHKEG